MTIVPDDYPFLPPKRKTRIQKIIGALLYYGRAVDSTILPCIGSLGSAQVSPTEKTDAIVDHLLDYLSTHPDAIVWYHASGMIRVSTVTPPTYLRQKHAR